MENDRKIFVKVTSMPMVIVLMSDSKKILGNSRMVKYTAADNVNFINLRLSRSHLLPYEDFTML